MIKSMTGFGKSSSEVGANKKGESGAKKITVEIRTLNGKQLDLAIKMPGAYRAAESEMRALAQRVVGRGKADVFVSVESAGGACGASVNGPLFGEYFRQISAAALEAGAPLDGGAVAAILRLPDVLGAAEGELTDDEKRALLAAFDGALAALDTFRAEEGDVLMRDILGRVGAIGALLKQVEPFEKTRTEAVRKRILENAAALNVPLDSNRLEQEMIFWVEKLDITEEKVRLTKHCEYFRETAREDDAGRKLGFIAQEMGREINTLGSKANDAGIQKIVVQMKDELEKIKEQLLNIL